MDMTAYFLGRAAGEGGGGFSVQSDYLQNDPSAKDYIKNRPFYSEITYDRAIVPLQEVQFESDKAPEGLLMGQIVIEENKAAIANNGQYNLIIDGVTHLITATKRPDLGEEEYLFYFGNLGMIYSDFTNSGEDYLGVIACLEHELILLLYLKTTETTHEVGLSYVGDTVPLIVEDEYDFVEVNDDFTYYVKPFPYGLYSMGLQEKDVFNVTFNDRTYTNLTWKNGDKFPVYLGNSSILGYGDDTGEDWFFAIAGENSVGFVTREAGPHTLSLEKASLPFTEVVHKIDSKYLDIDIDVEVPYTEDDKGNVTFKGDVKTSSGTSLNAVSNRLNTTNNTLSTVQNDLNTTKNDLNTVKDDLNTVKDDLNTVKDDLNTVKDDLNTTKNDLEENKPVQSDYLQNDSAAKDYIKNKPRIGQDYIILTDIENNANYIIQMANGSLISCKIPTSIEVTTNPKTMEYFKGEIFDPTGMVLTAHYGDGDSKVIEQYTYSMQPLETYGENKITISAEINSILYETTISVLVIHLNDFNYTDNGDGTYTLTGWKQTLNGVPSTEMIVPDSSRIII